MSTGLKVKAEKITAVWDLYSAGSYETAVRKFITNDNPDVLQIVSLSALELGKPLPIEQSRGTFSVLLEGMQAYHLQDAKIASKALGTWLLKKNYFNALVLRRFLKSSDEVENFSLIHAVCKKYIGRPAYSQLLAPPYLKSAYRTKNYIETLRIFEMYRESLSEHESVQMAAFACLHSGNYKEAERFMLFLHKKIHGSEYEIDYARIRSGYDQLIVQIPEMEKRRKKMNSDEQMNLGMAYLFNKQYKLALGVFESLRKDDATS